MTSTQHVWMTKQADIGRRPEFAALPSRPCIEIPDNVMDYRGDSIATRPEGGRSVAAFHDPAFDMAVDDIRHDDGIAAAGMVLTVSYNDTGEIETLLPGAEVDGLHVSSILSPPGRAIAKAAPGEQRTYAMPGANNRRVTLLQAARYGMHVANCVGTQEDRSHDTRSDCRTGTSTQQKSNPFWTTALCTAI